MKPVAPKVSCLNQYNVSVHGIDQSLFTTNGSMVGSNSLPVLGLAGEDF